MKLFEAFRRTPDYPEEYQKWVHGQYHWDNSDHQAAKNSPKLGCGAILLGLPTIVVLNKLKDRSERKQAQRDIYQKEPKTSDVAEDIKVKKGQVAARVLADLGVSMAGVIGSLSLAPQDLSIPGAVGSAVYGIEGLVGIRGKKRPVFAATAAFLVAWGMGSHSPKNDARLEALKSPDKTITVQAPDTTSASLGCENPTIYQYNGKRRNVQDLPKSVADDITTDNPGLQMLTDGRYLVDCPPSIQKQIPEEQQDQFSFK